MYCIPGHNHKWRDYPNNPNNCNKNSRDNNSNKQENYASKTNVNNDNKHKIEDRDFNMIEEIKKPVDPEAGGSARKAELQSIKQTAVDCKELLVERQRLEQMVKELQANGEIEQDKDYSGGFAEKFSK